MKYYNAATKQNPGHLFLNVEIREESDTFYRLYLYKAKRDKFTSRAKAEAHDVTGSVSWLEKGKLYVASSIGSFEWQPLNPGEHRTVGGINWADEYFCTEEEALAWANSINRRHDQPSYEALGDVWGVHFHQFD